MCGRYALYGDAAALSAHFGIDNAFDWGARWNIAPGQFSPVLEATAEGGRVAVLARWGLLPSWVRDPRAIAHPFNAKAETAATRPMFRHAMRRRRVLVPASGFYEWQPLGGRKQPWFIHRPDGRPLAFAGLLEHWSGFEGELVTYTVLTCAANATVAPIHERMPLILDEDDYAMWLDPALVEPEALRPLLATRDAFPLERYPVSRRVNRGIDDDAGLIEPVELSA
jgi:putative SOS response-associated peptidase YedK